MFFAPDNVGHKHYVYDDTVMAENYLPLVFNNHLTLFLIIK